ncbi:damage-inducible protein DinB [Deinococcus sp. KSM4-11]|uniref:DinB family protein n=1 Tax=Deinococcus sp. KSM4-11 TaxID=2568654 RepID=UPI0010A57A1F|nr:DinB family protein [Deinococcus sp. KSM4-11]THF88072.1 damage-inducible protein DinB [Deinococcus sp. KSM4-11]
MAADLLDTLLDSWDRTNRIIVNLLRALPPGGLEARALPGHPTVAQMLTHVAYVRLALVEENAPEAARPIPEEEWRAETDPDRIALELTGSAAAVRDAVRGRIVQGRMLDDRYDHPLLLLQHLIWHEGYHHGQIKLALQAAGIPIADEAVGPLTWGVWMRRS